MLVLNLKKKLLIEKKKQVYYNMYFYILSNFVFIYKGQFRVFIMDINCFDWVFYFFDRERIF